MDEIKARQQRDSEEIQEANDKSAYKWYTVIGFIILAVGIMCGIIQASLPTILEFVSVGAIIILLADILKFLYKINTNLKQK